MQLETSCEKAINWIKKNTTKGVHVSSKNKVPYPEVTGYTISTLYQWGEKELAKDLAIWLIGQQNKDGSFSSVGGVPYTFDTGQVVRGFLTLLNDFLPIEIPLRKACDYIVSQVETDGRLNTPSTKAWGKIADDRIHLYVLPPLIEAGKRLEEQRYIDSAKKVLRYYLSRDNLTKFNTLSHFHAYIIDALFDLGIPIQGVMQKIANLQRRDGSIPTYKNKGWICSTGVAQYAIIGYKLGMYDFADKAVQYLEKKQNPSGGFNGSYGWRANYFKHEEISWAVKFFLDAYYWKIKTSFDRQSPIFEDKIKPSDGRVKELFSFCGDISKKKALDVGCGKGRYLRLLKEKYPTSKLYGVDISQKMLEACPKKINTIEGSILDIPYPDKSFDFVYCIETLEHAIRIESAIKEMIRVLKPKGKLLIIDKNISHEGRLKIERWEKWFDPEEIINLLKKYGVNATYKSISYGEYKADGLFVAWEGVKNE